MFLYLISGSCQEKMYEKFQDFSAPSTSCAGASNRTAKTALNVPLLFHAVNDKMTAFGLPIPAKRR